MIIVTGASGFIGSNMIQFLNHSGYKNILAVDQVNHPQNYLNSCHISNRCDKNELWDLLPSLKGSVKTIFHLGACSDTTETDGLYIMKNNFSYSKKLLEWALDQNVDFIYASSASVYGNGDLGFKEESQCENPLNLYAFSKLAFDNYVRHILYSVNPISQVLGLRYFNVFGINEYHKSKMASVAFHFFNQLNDNNTLSLFEGSQSFYRDFIYIKDVLKINNFFFKNKLSGIYNCGTGTSRTFYDIASYLQTQHPGSTVSYIPFPEHLKYKYQTFTEANLNQLKKTGYDEAFFSLEEGLDDYFSILRKNSA